LPNGRFYLLGNAKLVEHRNAVLVQGYNVGLLGAIRWM
jgi:hypothetical protein